MIASAKRLLLALVFAVPVAAIVLPPAPVMAQTSPDLPAVTSGPTKQKKEKKAKKTKKTKKTKKSTAKTTG